MRQVQQHIEDIDIPTIEITLPTPMAEGQCVGADLKERIAIALWHRFAPEHHMEWTEEPHASEYNDAAESVLFLALAKQRFKGAHKVMTPEEYAAMPLIGWHEVCRDFDGLGGVGIRFITPAIVTKEDK